MQYALYIRPNKFEHIRHFFKKKKKKKPEKHHHQQLKAYKLNTLNNVMFMHKISTKTAPQCFIHACKHHFILIPLTFQNLYTRYLPTIFKKEILNINKRITPLKIIT